MTRAWAGRGIGTRAELERALGKPSDINKLDPVEQWKATTSPDEKNDQK